MPHSLILNILPQSPIPPNYLTGRHLHALFLTLVSATDQNLGDYLHAQKNDKAFTLSPLQITGQNHLSHSIYPLQWQHKKPIPTGTPCWWRISLLDDTLFTRLTKLWLNLNPDHSWHLGPADLHITGILGTPHKNQPWANFSTYSTLYQNASDTQRQIALNISTPASFRQRNFDSALPNPESVFQSLINRWNKYSPLEFPSSLTNLIFPSFFNIRTEMVEDDRSKFIGCIGEINYRILGDIEPEKIKQINSLADFAIYAGIGRKTTMGMGMVSRLSLGKNY